MLVFSKDKLDHIPQSVDEPKAALSFLFCSIFACLKSHAGEIDKDVELEAAIRLADDRLLIVVPKSCKNVITKACEDCYILKHVKWGWLVKIDDEEFFKLKTRG